MRKYVIQSKESHTYQLSLVINKTWVCKKGLNFELDLQSSFSSLCFERILLIKY
jgi:hypothetical protein